ncbi:MAG: hypothetical protein ACI83Y_001233 [Candidatus Azotimanducaceae bacterium]
MPNETRDPSELTGSGPTRRCVRRAIAQSRFSESPRRGFAAVGPPQSRSLCTAAARLLLRPRRHQARHVTLFVAERRSKPAVLGGQILSGQIDLVNLVEASGSEQARIGRPGCHRRRPDRDRPASLRWGSAPVAIRSCGTPAGHRDGEPDETLSTRRACYAVNTSHRRARSRRSSQHESGDAHLSRGARVPAVRGRRCQSARGPLVHLP